MTQALLAKAANTPIIIKRIPKQFLPQFDPFITNKQTDKGMTNANIDNSNLAAPI